MHYITAEMKFLRGLARPQEGGGKLPLSCLSRLLLLLLMLLQMPEPWPPVLSQRSVFVFLDKTKEGRVSAGPMAKDGHGGNFQG